MSERHRFHRSTQVQGEALPRPPPFLLTTMSLATTAPSLNRVDLDQTLARVSSKPNVSGALVLSKETGAIIRSTVADNELAKKYCLGVKRTFP